MQKFNLVHLLLIASFTLAAPVAAFAEDDEPRRVVEFEWEPVEAATAYELKMKRLLAGGKSNKPVNFKTDKAKWAGKIRPGRYELQIRAYDNRGVPGDWGESVDLIVKIPQVSMLEPKNQQIIKTDETEEEKISFKWQGISGAENYAIEVIGVDSDFKKTVTSDDTDTKIELPVAKNYKWRVTAVMPGGAKGEETKEHSPFTVLGAPLEPPRVKAPHSKFVEAITWKAPERAKSYNYAVQYKNKETKKWDTIEKKSNVTATKAPFSLARPGGKYRFLIQAEAPLVQKSPMAKIEFESVGNLRDPAAIKAAKLRESIEKPSAWYGIASYFITQINYEGYNTQESIGPSSYQAVNGTGRLGLGYQKPQSKLGYFGIVDLSGAILNETNHTYASLEMHTTYRHNMRSAGQLTYSGGIYVKQLPEIIGQLNPDEPVKEIEIRSALGVHGGVTYWWALNNKLGIQAQGRIYYPMMGDTPNGSQVESEPSYLLGLLGSYRLSKKSMGFAGITFKEDVLAYRAEPGPNNAPSFSNGDVNKVTLTGAFLNLKLEYSF